MRQRLQQHCNRQEQWQTEHLERQRRADVQRQELAQTQTNTFDAAVSQMNQQYQESWVCHQQWQEQREQRMSEQRAQLKNIQQQLRI